MVCKPRLNAFEKALRGETAVDTRTAGKIHTYCYRFRRMPNAPPATAMTTPVCAGVLRLSLSTEFAEKRIESMRTNLWMLSAVLVLVLGTALWLALRFSVLRPSPACATPF